MSKMSATSAVLHRRPNLNIIRLWAVTFRTVKCAIFRTADLNFRNYRIILFFMQNFYKSQKKREEKLPTGLCMNEQNWPMRMLCRSGLVPSTL
jgi:hypothetical protein